jgi:uncharacterized protein YqhQ
VNVENAQKFVTWHPRCGTSFMFVIMLISMLVYMLIPVQTIRGETGRFAHRAAARDCRPELRTDPVRGQAARFFPRAADRAGLWTQRITTKAPSDEQAAVAIRALDGAMALETQQGGELVIA